jgi:hypothetical protein
MVVVAQSNRKSQSPPENYAQRKQVVRHRFRPKDRRIDASPPFVEILASTQTPYALNLFQLLMRPRLMVIQLEMGCREGETRACAITASGGVETKSASFLKMNRPSGHSLGLVFAITLGDSHIRYMPWYLRLNEKSAILKVMSFRVQMPAPMSTNIFT